MASKNVETKRVLLEPLLKFADIPDGRWFDVASSQLVLRLILWTGVRTVVVGAVLGLESSREGTVTLGHGQFLRWVKNWYVCVGRIKILCVGHGLWRVVWSRSRWIQE